MNETIDATKINAGQLVQRIMRAMDGADRPESTAKYAEHIAAEILKLPADYWTSAAPTTPIQSEIERLTAENERLKNCHRIITKQAGYYAADLPDDVKVEIHLGILRAAERCAGVAPWEADHEQTAPEEELCPKCRQHSWPSVNWKDGKSYAYCHECGHREPA